MKTQVESAPGAGRTANSAARGCGRSGSLWAAPPLLELSGRARRPAAGARPPRPPHGWQTGTVVQRHAGGGRAASQLSHLRRSNHDRNVCCVQLRYVSYPDALPNTGVFAVAVVTRGRGRARCACGTRLPIGRHMRVRSPPHPQSPRAHLRRCKRNRVELLNSGPATPAGATAKARVSAVSREACVGDGKRGRRVSMVCR